MLAMTGSETEREGTNQTLADVLASKDKPEFVRPRHTVREAASVIASQKKAVLVVEEGELAGIFTPKDMMNRVITKVGLLGLVLFRLCCRWLLGAVCHSGHTGVCAKAQPRTRPINRYSASDFITICDTAYVVICSVDEVSYVQPLVCYPPYSVWVKHRCFSAPCSMSLGHGSIVVPAVAPAL